MGRKFKWCKFFVLCAHHVRLQCTVSTSTPCSACADQQKKNTVTINANIVTSRPTVHSKVDTKSCRIQSVHTECEGGSMSIEVLLKLRSTSGNDRIRCGILWRTLKDIGISTLINSRKKFGIGTNKITKWIQCSLNEPVDMNIYLEETVKDEPNSGFVNIIYRSAARTKHYQINTKVSLNYIFHNIDTLLKLKILSCNQNMMSLINFTLRSRTPTHVLHFLNCSKNTNTSTMCGPNRA